MTRMPTVVEAFTLALQHHQAGRLLDAEALYRQVLQVQPDHPDALHNLGMIACQVDRYDVAVDCISRAIRGDPSRADFCNNLGDAYRRWGKLNEALSSYRQALAVSPGLLLAITRIGGTLKQQGKLDEAAAHYRQMLRLYPESVDLYNNLGNVLQEQGHFEEAVAQYRQAVALRPDSAEVHNNIGWAFYTQGRLEEAVRHYQQALALKPDYIQAILNLSAAQKGPAKADDPIQNILSCFLSGPKDPIFDRAVLSYDGNAHVRGKPRRYLECACQLLRYLAERSNRPMSDLVIVEIGSMSSAMSHGFEEYNPQCCSIGHSTVFWARTGAATHTVDVNPDCPVALSTLCQEYPNLVVHTGDGCQFLKEFGQPIDLLHLDAWDVQLGTRYAEKHAEAYEAARPRLAASCIVSIDDTDVDSGGKGRLVIPLLVRDGFEIVAYGRQTIALRLSPP
jgi:tetratricopeptide (TPR) repeat protein